MTIILNGTTGITTPGITNQGVVEFTAGSVGAPSITTTSDTNTGIYFPAADTIAFTEGGVESMRINSSGNLGLGVTPSPWDTLTAFDIGAGGGVWGTAAQAALGSNVYFVNPNFKYKQTNVAAALQIDGNIFKFFNAPSGSANATISFTQAMTLDASGNLGLGVTPSAWTTFSSALEVPGGALAGISANQVGVWQNCFYNSSSFKYKSTAGATLYQQAGSVHAWFNAASGTAGNAISFTQAMTLTAAGGLTVGNTSDPGAGNISANGDFRLSSNSFSRVAIGDGGGGWLGGYSITYSGGPVYSDTGAISGIYYTNGGVIRFFAGPSAVGGTAAPERARITAAGDLLVGTTTTGGKVSVFNASGDASQPCIYFQNNKNFTGVQGINANSGNVHNDTGHEFLYCNDIAGGGVVRMTVRSNGGIANYSANDVNLSDERTKKDIALLGSMWDKFKAIEIVTFKYKDQTHDDDNIGVIAQQVESVAPEFVDIDGFGETPEDGVPLKSIYTADMYHAAIKALQEAMARIETLEAKVTALESK